MEKIQRKTLTQWWKNYFVDHTFFKVQPDHDMNGHGYPYNYHLVPNQNQPKPDSSNSEEPDSSSEENPQEGGQNQGHAWAEPGKSVIMQIPDVDRRNYGRANDKDPSADGSEHSHWSVPETSQPQSGSFQPSTWRGMGPGFEKRPSIPSRNRLAEQGGRSF